MREINPRKAGVMKNIILDSQLLTTLMACPRKAEFRFNQDLERHDGKSNALECGSLVHAILEFYNKALLEGQNRSDAIEVGFKAGHEFIAPYSDYNKYITDKEHLGMINTPEESGKDDSGREQKGWSFVIKTMEEYFDFYRYDKHIVIGVEDVRQKLLYEDSDLRILWKAKFDVIHETELGIISTDYKTMSQRRATDSKNNQFMGQCFILGARQVRVDKIGFQKSLKPHEKFERIFVPYSVDRLSEWANDIVPFYANMLLAYSEAGNYPPNFTQCESKYGMCEYSDICNLDRNLREETIKMNFVRGKKWDI